MHADLRRLKEAAETDPSAMYKPTMPDECVYGDSQYLFHRSVAKLKLAYGANRSGKTRAILQELEWHISGKYPEWYRREGRFYDGETRNRPLVVRMYATNFEEGINMNLWPTLQAILPRDLRTEPIRQNGKNIIGTNIPNGVVIRCGTYNQDEQSPAGTVSDITLFDEPPKTENQFFEIVRGTLDRRGRILMGLTPVDCDWLDQLIIESGTQDPDERYKNFVAYFDLRDNPHVPEEEKTWWANTLTEDQKMARLEGKPMSVVARIYPEFDPNAHVVDDFDLPMKGDGKNIRPDGWCLWGMVDPHDAKPPALVYIAVFNPVLGGGVPKIFVILDDWTSQSLNIPVIVQAMKERELTTIGAIPSVRVMDPNFGSKHMILTGNTVQAEFKAEGRKVGYPMVFRLGVDNQAFGHSRVRTMLSTRMPAGRWEGEPQLQVFRSGAPNVAASFPRYKRKRERNGTLSKKPVDDKYKHWMDNIRYFAAAPGEKYLTEPEEDGDVKKMTLLERIAYMDGARAEGAESVEELWGVE